MADLLSVIIDITELEPGLAQRELEVRAVALAEEIRLGQLTNSIELAREQELLDGAKAGLLASIGGILTAEISRDRLVKALNFFGNRFYGKTVKLSYKADGNSREYSFEGKPDEIDRLIEKIERLEDIRIRVIENAPNQP